MRSELSNRLRRLERLLDDSGGDCLCASHVHNVNEAGEHTEEGCHTCRKLTERQRRAIEHARCRLPHILLDGPMKQEVSK